MADAKQPAKEEEAKPISMAEFLETIAPLSSRKIKNLQDPLGGGEWKLSLPTLQLHCDHCDGVRTFHSTDNRQYIPPAALTDVFMVYSCRNCGRETKSYALEVRSDTGGPAGAATKYGELPPFGPPTPRQLWALVDAEKDAYLKGRRCETQGLGIGAFAYYRRVVENQKNRILDEIIKVAEKTRAAPETIATLKAAKNENQFKRAMEMVKDAIPATLLIDGHHNPLTLLHDALSEHLHDHSDEKCLALATSIREVLQDLGERSASALRNRAALTAAVGQLQNRVTREQ